MELGEELKVVSYSKKYGKKTRVLVDMIPVVLACVMVCLLSWSKLEKSGMSEADRLMLLGAVCAAVLMVTAAFFYASRRSLRKTYLKVCRFGIAGVAQQGSLQTREFALPYSAIRKVQVRVEQLVITTAEGKLTLTPEDPEGTKELIRSFMR